MPYWLAIEWNDEELQAVAALRHRNRLTIEQAFAVSLSEQVSGESSVGKDKKAELENVGRRLAAALAARGIRHPVTFVALSRSLVELRQMQTPPVGDDELPDLVRFQALREFTHVTEDWTIDFLTLDDDPSQPRSVLVAALAPQLLQQIQQTCQVAQLRPEKVLLRPCAAASLARRCVPPQADEIRLLIDLLVDDVDLSVVVGEKLVFMRTARLSGDALLDADAATNLVAEVRRTMVAAQNQLGGGRANHIVLCGDTPPHQALAHLLQERLDIPVTCFNPFQHFELGKELGDNLPDHPGQYAPLLGVLADEAEKIAPALDFLHPHRRPEPPSARNRYALAVLAGCLMVLLGITYGWFQLQDYDDQISRLKSRQAAIERQLKEAVEVRRLADSVEAWTQSNINWLEELKRLNQKIPPPQEMMLGKLTMMAGARGGEITMEGFAASPQSVEKMEHALDDPQHRVIPKGKAEDDSQKPYKLRFGTTLVVVPPETAAGKGAPSRAPARLSAHGRTGSPVSPAATGGGR